MRIAFFTDTYLPNTDGVVTSLVATKAELERRGHEVYIFSPGTKKQKEENKDPTVYYLSSTSFKPYPDYRIALVNFLSPLKLIEELGIDFIHSHGIATTSLVAIRCSQKFGIPIIATFHTMVPEAVHYLTTQRPLKAFLQNVAWQYLSWLYSHFPKVIVPSEWARKVLEAHGIKNTVVLPSGFNIDDFKDVESSYAKREFNLRGHNVILHVGRVALEKRLELLIDAASSVLNILPNAKFVIAGKGPAENYYKSLVVKNSLQQHFLFTGYVEKKMLHSLYAAADAFVFPSMFDTQGLVVLEAMACGAPVIVQKDSAPADFVVDGINGYLFNDHFDLPEKIRAAIKNKRKTRKAAIETAKNFDIRKTVDKLLDLYKNIMRSANSLE
jgi:1,2-diacylglycerol 3-alpha-glucosyltransferase